MQLGRTQIKIYSRGQSNLYFRYLASLPGDIGADAASRVIVGDFFTHVAPGDGYSIIYDYTFSGTSLPNNTDRRLISY